MFFVATYTNQSGVQATAALMPKMRWRHGNIQAPGVSTANAVIEQKQGFWEEVNQIAEQKAVEAEQRREEERKQEAARQLAAEHAKSELLKKQEELKKREEYAQDPANFHKILTNDDAPCDNSGSVQYEYKHLRIDYKGRGITQELSVLDIDGSRVTGWFDGKNVPTLPEIFQTLGNAGWQMIGHQINQDLQQNGLTFHYYNFMRVKRGEDRTFVQAVHEKNLFNTAIVSLGA